MEIVLSKRLSQRLAKFSEQFDWKAEEVVIRALLSYLNAVKQEVFLKKEMEAWDKLSDEALISFEKSLMEGQADEDCILTDDDKSALEEAEKDFKSDRTKKL